MRLIAINCLTALQKTIDILALCLLLSVTLRLEGNKSQRYILVKSPCVAGCHSILYWWKNACLLFIDCLWYI